MDDDYLDALHQLARQNRRVAKEVVPDAVPDDVVRATRVFGSPVRVAIIRLLAHGPVQQTQAAAELGLGYSTFRLNVLELVEAGAVRILDPDDRITGKPVFYKADIARIRELGAALVAWATGQEL